MKGVGGEEGVEKYLRKDWSIGKENVGSKKELLIVQNLSWKQINSKLNILSKLNNRLFAESFAFFPMYEALFLQAVAPFDGLNLNLNLLG